mmetsp:Transcript_93869/g.191194  ORF Transcript_93869/g.191194 Transcript_93869/m.191194 type:complete len:108 (-) Transcript_93869:1192-1515(-)
MKQTIMMMKNFEIIDKYWIYCILSKRLNSLWDEIVCARNSNSKLVFLRTTTFQSNAVNLRTPTNQYCLKLREQFFAHTIAYCTHNLVGCLRCQRRRQEMLSFVFGQS